MDEEKKQELNKAIDVLRELCRNITCGDARCID